MTLGFEPYRFFDPMAIGLGLAAVGLWLAKRHGAIPETKRRRRARRALWVLLALLYVASCPLCVQPAVGRLEWPGVDVDRALEGHDRDKVAVVVLSGGFRSNTGELPDGEIVDGATQARVLAAARIAREKGIHRVIATGGPLAMANGMRELLISLGVPEDEVLVETESTNTHENATMSAAICRAHAIDTVVVVTSALHLPRAARYFERTGLAVIPVAGDYLENEVKEPRPTDLLPSSYSFDVSMRIWHELLGTMQAALIKGSP